MKKPPGASCCGCAGRLLHGLSAILGYTLKGVQEPNIQPLEIFYVTCYESKTMGQSGCSNPGVIFRSFVWYMKPCTTISYSSVDNKSPFLKFLSDC